MGNVNKINVNIGTENFLEPIEAKSEKLTCISNCRLVKVDCSWYLKFMSTSLMKIFSSLGFNMGNVKCPVEYYECKGNIAKINKLTSGYYNIEYLNDGTAYPKPKQGMKCSHGGILDEYSYSVQATGGINKDSGIYLLSPHADLHLIAANLAIKHTQYYFDQIREKIGDEEFAKFLNVFVSYSIWNSINQYVKICSKDYDFYFFVLPVLFIFVLAAISIAMIIIFEFKNHKPLFKNAYFLMKLFIWSRQSIKYQNLKQPNYDV